MLSFLQNPDSWTIFLVTTLVPLAVGTAAVGLFRKARAHWFPMSNLSALLGESDEDDHQRDIMIAHLMASAANHKDTFPAEISESRLRTLYRQIRMRGLNLNETLSAMQDRDLLFWYFFVTDEKGRFRPPADVSELALRVKGRVRSVA